MKNMRRISWLLAMVLILGCTAFPAGAEGEMKLLSITAIEEDTVWVHTTAGLVPFSKEGEMIGEPLYPEAEYYAIGPEGTIYYGIDRSVIGVDREGNQVDLLKMPFGNVKRLLFNDAFMLVIMNGTQYSSMGMESRAMKVKELSGTKDIEFYGADRFVVLRENIVSQLILAECNESGEIDYMQLNDLAKYEGIVFNPAGEGCYLYTQEEIYRLDSFDGEASVYMSLRDMGNISDVAFGQDNVYVIADGVLKAIEKPDSNAQGDAVEVEVHFTFGSYEQDNNPENGPEPIEWRILDAKDGKALVISTHALELMQYHEPSEVDRKTTWEKWDLRTWLNGEFMEAAFTEEEKARIPVTTVKAHMAHDCYTDPGNDTQDQIFLLSVLEARQYFSSNGARKCLPTAAATANYALRNGEEWIPQKLWYGENIDGECFWWLRSPGESGGSPSCVNGGGFIAYFTSIDMNRLAEGLKVEYGVRPAMWLELEP
ncbi:MAG: hypothetical protein E7335_06905 [Clostridiales bacterium]|nr:hypothetical protein [Clostridiales bacterium]